MARRQWGSIKGLGENKYLVTYDVTKDTNLRKLDWVIGQVDRDDTTGEITRDRRSEVVVGSREDAEVVLEQRKMEIRRGEFVANKATLDDWFTVWIRDHVAVESKPRTVETYADLYRLYIRGRLGPKRLTAIDAEDIQHLKATIMRSYSRNTCVSVFKVLGGMFRRAERMGHVVTNPVKMVKSPPREDSEMYVPSNADVLATLGAAEADGSRFALALHVGAFCGLREGEIMGLQWGAVDLANREMHIRAQVARTKAGLVIQTPKTPRSRRTVPMDQRTAALLLRHFTDSGYQGKDDLVFANAKHGGPIEPGLSAVFGPGRVEAVFTPCAPALVRNNVAESECPIGEGVKALGSCRDCDHVEHLLPMAGPRIEGRNRPVC